MPLTLDAVYTNNAATTLAGGAGGIGTSLNVADGAMVVQAGTGTLLPSTAGGWTFLFLLGTLLGSYEFVRCTSKSTDTLTITRAAEDGALHPARTWAPGTPVTPVASAANLQALSKALHNLVPGRFNVLDYGAVGDGSTDDQAAGQAAYDACRLAGGGIVFWPKPPSAYLINSCPVHPVDGSINCSLVIGSKTITMGDGPGNTIIRAGASIPNQGRLMSNYNRLSAVDTDIALVDLEFDGNAAAMNTGVVDAQFGPSLVRLRRALFRNIYAHDFFGSGSGGNGPNGTQAENWHLDTHNSADVRFEHCVVTDTGSNHTGLGFAANGSTGVAFTDCKASNMKYSRGFSNWHCAIVQYENCHAYQQQNASLGGEGFNSEISGTVIYTNCVSGGTAADQAGIFTASQALGNASHGFRVDSAVGRHFWGMCNASSNGGAGIFVSNGGSGQLLQVTGGAYRINTSYGINISDAGSAGLLRIDGGTHIVGNNSSGDQIQYDGTNHTPLPATSTLTAPAVPGSTTVFTNPFPFPCLVRVTGGTVTVIAVNGITEWTATGNTVIVPFGATIALTYSSPPSWSWRALAY